MSSQRVLIFDIETAPILAYVWGTRDQNIAINQIRNDWYVLAWSAKWLGDPASKVMYRDQRGAKNIEDDRRILEPLWKLLDRADIVITQNGKNFDSPRLNARFIQHGMPPPSPYKHLDTYQIVRRVAKFTSSKLEFLTEKLCTKYKKLSHKKYPGFSLWTACLSGDRKAWDAMKQYNIHDVLSTEEFYMKIRAWAPESAPSVYVGDLSECGTCGSKSFTRKGYQYSRISRRRQIRCKACKRWTFGKREAL